MSEGEGMAKASVSTLRRVILAAIPVLIFVVLAAFLLRGLDLNPKEIPSVMIDKPVPEFSLPPLPRRDDKGLSTADLKQGQVALVNVFASWCVACRAEHPILMDLKERGIVAIHGMDYKDKPEDGQRWLEDLGDPYDLVGNDLSGRVGIDWGVYGVPETFLVSGDGRILCKQIGPITPKILRNKILPAIEAAKAGRKVTC